MDPAMMIPGMTGPPMLPPEFSDPSVLPHDSKQPDIIAAVVVTWALGASFVAARFYTKLGINGAKIGMSEWAILVACIFSLATSICILMQVKFGIGAHIYDLPADVFNPIGNAESQWISIIFYSLSLAFSKVSILILYISIFYHSWVRPASYVVFAILVLSHVWVLYVIFTACIPIQAFWDPSTPGAVCMPQTYFLANQYLSIGTDFIMFLLPVPVVWNLKIRWQQKCLLLFLFTLGFFVCTLSILRIVFLTPLLANAGVDFTYNSSPIFYWTAVEINLAIAVACAITLKPFIKRFMPRLLSSKGAPTTGASPVGKSDGLATYGSARAPKNHIRVDSSFTTQYDKQDEEYGYQ